MFYDCTSSYDFYALIEQHSLTSLEVSVLVSATGTELSIEITVKLF